MATTLGYDGWVAKITPEGQLIPFASGLRSPAGIGIRSNDELFYTDNQGGWVGSSTLHQIVEGGFYGYPCSLLDKAEYRAGKKLDIEEFSQQRKQPVLWLPHGELVNSPGNRTLPFELYKLQGVEGVADYPIEAAFTVLTILPFIIFYTFVEKHVVAGLVSGSGK